MIIEIIPCLSDNYSYLIYEEKTNTVSIVDPAEFEACDKIINKYKKLDFILNTHHHADHVGANLELKRKYDSKILGSKSDKDRILTKWAGLLENKLPFTADFIYSDRRALLISTWAIIIFYSQILGFNTFSEAELQNIVQGFGSSGIINAFTYGENLTNDVYLWFIITQAIGLHWIIYLPLSAHWIKKVIL